MHIHGSTVYIWFAFPFCVLILKKLYRNWDYHHFSLLTLLRYFICREKKFSTYFVKKQLKHKAHARICYFFRMLISLFFFFLDGSDLSQALQEMSTAYEEIGTMYEMQPKHDWDPLSNLLFEYRGLIYSFSSVNSLLKVCDCPSNWFI